MELVFTCGILDRAVLLRLYTIIPEEHAISFFTVEPGVTLL
jgi:hypothetical protein